MSENEDINRHKKLAYLSQIQSSVLRIRRSRIPLGRDWQEQVVAVDRVLPFDVIIRDGRANVSGSSMDIDEYLNESEYSIGSIEQVFQRPSDWEMVLRPIIASDNTLALVDRYLDLDRLDYSQAFGTLADLMRQYSAVKELRLVIGPQSTSDDLRSEEHKLRLSSVSKQVKEFLRKDFPDLKTRVTVFSAKGLHKRYLTNKVCGIELDYGLRISRSQRQRISVLRASQLKDVRETYLTLVAGGVSAWPAV